MSWKLVVVAAMGAWNALAASLAAEPQKFETAATGSAAVRDDLWRMLPIDGGGYVMNVVFTHNPKVAYMTFDVGGPYRSDDGLRTWRPLHGAMTYDMKRRFFSSPRSLSVDPRDENSVVVAAGNNARRPAGIVVSRAGSGAWTRLLAAPRGPGGVGK